MWYNNAQGPVDTPVPIPADGNYIFHYLDLPTKGDRPVMLSSDFVVEVENSGRDPLNVYAQIGVSNPSEYEYPLRPFVGVMHSVCRVTIPPGAKIPLHVIRLDVIDPTLLPVNMPWTLAIGADKKNYPRLAPQVLGPAGTKVTNCAVRVLMMG